jgi:hippurate hydrolase
MLWRRGRPAFWVRRWARARCIEPATKPGGTASEDYSEYVAAGVTHSVFFGVGGQDPAMVARYKAEGKPLPVNHSPFFAPVPEPSIRAGAETLALAVLMVTSRP